ncbi:hypochlorite stress DNA-binding transcriptional regulator HypT [Brenneria izbisi]|uniref:Hypochlorite stress DNA-binding transcriptional regulator HypT n=1 Tax=Brenneria izbisi TaxID=2939450 RepID=A0AA42C1W3_9GAMM|nr:hypochlorite stress DNA-binding transcriptional regulator HypT [Brenneria izbisi]MCV9878123.1 hypochlorite stress DNA-binding transcriptional regulator HypT [Brenneria izbisi]MCV9881313.1 hypochlorite stress DNA-binding transcriptional regulator HypT [Brenneria izbisi]
MLNNIETKWLYDFIALEEYRSFTTAAEKRNISQSSFSRRIRALETAIGFDLFDRASSPLQLTEPGRVFHAHIRNTLDDLEYQLNKLHGGSHYKNKITIAAAHSLSVFLMPELLKTVPEPQEKIFYVESIDVDEAVLNLKEGRSDFIFSFYNEELMSEPFMHEKIRESRLYPVCACDSNGNPLFDIHAPSVPLLNYTDTSYMGRQVSRYLSSVDSDRFTVHFVSSMSDLLKRMTKSGYGIAWLPDYSIKEELKSQELVILDKEDAAMSMGVYLYRLDARLNMASEKFWRYIKALPREY